MCVCVCEREEIDLHKNVCINMERTKPRNNVFIAADPTQVSGRHNKNQKL